MSLPVDSTRVLADSTEPSVTVVLDILGTPENRTYPGCYAAWSAPKSSPGAELLVFAYADGRGASPRARWALGAVLGIEHSGDHMAARQKPPVTPEKRHPVVPAAGPDYPADAAKLVDMANSGELFIGQPQRNTLDPQATRSFPAVEQETPPGGSGIEESFSPIDDPGISSLSEAREEKPQEDGWKPRGQVTRHRELKTPKETQASTLRLSRGTAKRAVRGAGALLLLGFALLGYTPNA